MLAYQVMTVKVFHQGTSCDIPVKGEVVGSRQTMWNPAVQRKKETRENKKER